MQDRRFPFIGKNGIKFGHNKEKQNLYKILDRYPNASFAASMQPLSRAGTDSHVVRVRRDSDNTESGFTASEVGNGTLLDFVVPPDVQALYNESMYFDNNINNIVTLGINSLAPILDNEYLIDIEFETAGLDSDNATLFGFAINNTLVGVECRISDSTITVSGRSEPQDSYQAPTISHSVNIFERHTWRAIWDYENSRVGAYVDDTFLGWESVNFGSSTYNPGTPTIADAFGVNVGRTNTLKGVITNIKIKNKNGVLLYATLGNSNTNSGWEDTVGSNDGTVNGSPDLFTGQGFNGYFSTKYDQRVPTTKQRMYFDGSDDEVEVAYDAVFDRGSSTLKVRGKFITTKTETILIDNRNSNPNIKGFFIGINGAGKINTKLYEGSTSVGETINSVASCNDGKEHTFEWIYDGATLSLQLDNATPVTVASVNGDTDGIFPIVFGNVSRTSSLGRLEGTIYDVEWEVGEEVVGHWQGYGNTDADWKDQIGSNDGTVNGSPARLSTLDYTTVSADAVQPTADDQPLIVKDGAINLENTKAVGLYDDDYLRISADDLPSPTDKFTISAVVKNNKSSLSGNEYIFSKYDVGYDNRCFGFLFGDGEELQITFGDPSDGTFVGSQISDNAITTDELQVVGVTFDAGTVKLYRNGVELASINDFGSIPSTLFDSDADWTIGCNLNSDSPQLECDGDIGEIYYADNLDDDITAIQKDQMRRFGI